jgi:hypothetical protein
LLTDAPKTGFPKQSTSGRNASQPVMGAYDPAGCEDPANQWKFTAA